MYSLITTKFEIPPQPDKAILRERLVEALEGGIGQVKLVLVTAPAGYGKSTLLTQWANASRLKTAWFTCGVEDNEFERFFRSLATAWDMQQPGLMDESPLGILLGGTAPQKEAILSTFINTASGLNQPLAFVLDDFHLVRDEECLVALVHLLDHLPHQVHFVLGGREEPRLPLARYRARGHLMEIGTAELGFSTQETQDYFREQVDQEFEKTKLQTVQERLEGWAAGYQLVALALRQGLTNINDLALSGDQRFIADFLREEVLTNQSQEARRFMLQTGFLERLSASLCEAVTQMKDGQQMLELLERKNLFLLPLDDRRHWYRYHELFGDFLQKEAQRQFPSKIKEWHSRAARWYLDQKMPEPAFRHSLAALDSETMAELAYRYFEPMLHLGELKQLQRWLEAIPREWHFLHPDIGLGYAFFLAYTGDIEACLIHAEKIEQALQQSDREDKGHQLARITTLRCVIACAQQKLELAEPLASQALQELPQSDHHYRADIYHAIGEAYRDRGRWQEAREQYFRALELVQDPAYRMRSAHIYGALADLELQRGLLRKAADYWQEALDVIEDQQFWGRMPQTLRGWVHMRMGEIRYEWDELEAAADFLTRGLQRAQIGGDVRALIAGRVLLGRLYLTEGNSKAAQDCLEEASSQVEGSPFHEWNSRYQRLQVEIWLAQEKLDRVKTWSEQKLSELAKGSHTMQETVQLALARALLAQKEGQAHQQARKLLDRLAAEAQEQGRLGIQIEALALQVVANWQEDHVARAMTVLEKALRLARPQGYLRLFADLGLPMARALQEASNRQVMLSYVERLLAAFRRTDIPADGPQEPLPEPLTDREQEILRLMAAGLTNREIGEELFIAAGTVKKHAGNIYSKLGVGGRTEAAARARELELLE